MFKRYGSFFLIIPFGLKIVPFDRNQKIMKKLITLIALLSISSLYGQTELRLTESNPVLKPLIILNYQGDQIKMKDRSLDGIEPAWIETINVLKGSSAISVYGETDGKDGVIILTLKRSDEIKAFFEKELKRVKSLTEITTFQDASLRKVEEEEEEEEKLSNSRATIKIRETNGQVIKPLIVVDFKGEVLRLSEKGTLDEITLENVTSISVLKDQESIEQYEADKKAGIILLKLDESKKSAKLFKKLKKNKEK